MLAGLHEAIPHTFCYCADCQALAGLCGGLPRNEL